ncbi:uncharacterized protein LOC132721945 [Ruditapes philippinarum]|uniref:uncharacterized protein LOC132721945 n=1 Tax=Ruditapes philippinarum TaxID=129788 RepID=UPI00295C0B6E|nr:uncharacterized protein LOC132721945 [Ruditapes philippinarum]
MCVHVFGNCASPAVATYGLRKAVQNAEKEIQKFVCRNFYVDDALSSQHDAQQAINLMKKTRVVLKEEGNIRLHKIASNSPEVMSAFNKEDLGSDLKTLDLFQDTLPVQRSLGVSWDLKQDNFIFDVVIENKPFTLRGVLSMVNSIFDPLGFIAPITITGKILLREAAPPGVDWDSPLPPDHEKKWIKWRESVQNLQTVAISPHFFKQLLLNSR